MKRDSIGRFHPNNQPRPKWTEPHVHKPEVAGYIIIKYCGFVHPGRGKRRHKYKVQCITCNENYYRFQDSLTRAEKKGSEGCQQCSKQRHMAHLKASAQHEQEQIDCALEWWLMALFVMPVTSLYMRKPFDSEKAKILGWRTI